MSTIEIACIQKTHNWEIMDSMKSEILLVHLADSLLLWLQKSVVPLLAEAQ